MIQKNQQLEKFENFVIFQTKKGKVNVNVFFAFDTLWLTQKMMAKLFDTTKQNISLHLKNIFEEKELNENSVVKNFLTTAEDSKVYKTKFYSLDAIIAVGYRVNSNRATKFRIWATGVLKDFIIKGFVLDDDRLKQMKHFGKDYFEELLDRIREIRSSERRFYQKITDIYALSADYDKDSGPRNCLKSQRKIIKEKICSSAKTLKFQLQNFVSVSAYLDKLRLPTCFSLEISRFYLDVRF